MTEPALSRIEVCAKIMIAMAKAQSALAEIIRVIDSHEEVPAGGKQDLVFYLTSASSLTRKLGEKD